MQISVAVIHVNGLLDLDNSAHHTMPHSIIAKSKDEQLLSKSTMLRCSRVLLFSVKLKDILSQHLHGVHATTTAILAP